MNKTDTAEQSNWKKPLTDLIFNQLLFIKRIVTYMLQSEGWAKVSKSRQSYPEVFSLATGVSIQKILDWYFSKNKIKSD